MKEKRTFYSEAAYFIGIVILALGTALMTKADFGVSMIVAPAYLLHLKLSPYFSFFTFGVAEYVFQAFILIVLAICLHKIKKCFFLSFGTAFIYGIILDAMMFAVGKLNLYGIVWQIVMYILGLIICATGVALLFRTYFPPEAYELFVKEMSEKHNVSLGKMKTIYDFGSCILAIIMSLCFFGGFVGVEWGTFVCAIFNGWLIGFIGRLLENRFVFKDGFSIRSKLN